MLRKKKEGNVDLNFKKTTVNSNRYKVFTTLIDHSVCCKLKTSNVALVINRQKNHSLQSP